MRIACLITEAYTIFIFAGAKISFVLRKCVTTSKISRWFWLFRCLGVLHHLFSSFFTETVACSRSVWQGSRSSDKVNYFCLCTEARLDWDELASQACWKSRVLACECGPCKTNEDRTVRKRKREPEWDVTRRIRE